MPQLTKGARSALEQLAAFDADTLDLLTKASEKVKFDPDYSRQLIARAADVVRHAARRRQTELEPLLERQAPEYEKRLQELLERVEALEQERTIVFSSKEEAAR